MILKALGATRGLVSRVFAVEYAAARRGRGARGQRARGACWPGRCCASRSTCRGAWAPGTLAGSACVAATALAVLVGFLGTTAPARPPAARRAPKRVTLAERLRALYPEASGRSLKQWLEAGRVDGQRARLPATAGRELAAGDTVALAGRRAAPVPARALAACTRTTRSSSWSSRRPAHRRHRSRARAAPRTACSGTTSRASRVGSPAVHRPPAGSRDVGPARVRQVRGDEAGAPGPVRGAHRGARVPRAGRGRGRPEERGTLESRLVEDRMLAGALGARRAARPSRTTGSSGGAARQPARAAPRHRAPAPDPGAARRPGQPIVGDVEHGGARSRVGPARACTRRGSASSTR